MKTHALAIHGGAGTLVKGMMTPELETKYREDLKLALESAYNILKAGGSAVDAVEKAVIDLEDSPLFNAGKGSVFTATEAHEMDASIMDGKTLNAGAVTLIDSVKNPIRLARDIMDNSEHVFLAGEGAMEFAKLRQHVMESPDYFYDEFRHEQWLEIKDSDTFQLDHSVKKDSKFGTVGAVALDIEGNLAAATSTGGMTNKRYGRIGDSPIIGSGTYANNKTCAVSCTGNGEFFIRAVAAYDLACLIEHRGWPLEKSANAVIHERIKKINGEGGLIAVDRQGHIAMPFNTEGMYRASIDASGRQIIAIYK